MALGTFATPAENSGGGGGGSGGGGISTDAAVNAYMGAAASRPTQPRSSAPAVGETNYAPQPSQGDMWRFLRNIYGTQDQQIQASQQDLLNQLGLTNAMYDTQAGYLRTNYGFDQRNLGLDRRAMDVDRGSIARQLASLVQQEEIIRGLDANSRKALGKQYAEDVASEKSDATARGAFTTPGTRTNLKNLFGDLMLGNERLDLGLRQDILGLNDRRGSLQDQRRMLDIQSRRYGIQGDQLRSQLDQALQGLGLDRMTSVNDIFAALNSGNAQRAALAQQMLDDLMRYGVSPTISGAGRRDDWYGRMRRGN